MDHAVWVPAFAGRSELPPELVLQLHLRPLQSGTLGLRQGLSGAVDIEGQHRQRRAIGAGLAARTMLCRALERRAIFFALASLKTPRFRSSASLSRVTRCDHRFGDDFFAVVTFSRVGRGFRRRHVRPILFAERLPDRSVPRRAANDEQFAARSQSSCGTLPARRYLVHRASCLPQFDVKTLGLGRSGVFFIGPIRWM